MAYTSNPPGRAPWDGFLKEDQGALSPGREHLAGKRVLITGAGGYLGAAAALAFAEAAVFSLCLLDIVEHGLYRLQGELERARFTGSTNYILGSVNDAVLLREIFARHRPQIVIHAAALKHVPMLQHNSIAAATTNILGTRSVVETAVDFEVERFLFLSTDKAVDAVGIMGATKRVAEILVLATEGAFPRVIRLCNVLGSSGSVAPLFARQIACGECLSVTDREATRYFMSRSAAVSCILEGASSTGRFRLAVPRRAEQRSVLDLAEYLLVQAHKVSSCIRFTQLRPGERRHERLWAADEYALSAEAGSRLQPLLSPVQESDFVERALAEISHALQRRHPEELNRALAALVPSLSEVFA